MPNLNVIVLCLICFSWWPFFAVLFYLACPLPTMISKRQNYDNSSSCLELSIFITVGIILSSFALPVVLYLAGTILVGACTLNLLGNVVVYFTLFGFFLGKFLYIPKVRDVQILISKHFSIPGRSRLANLSLKGATRLIFINFLLLIFY